MQYLGGKFRLRKEISNIINEEIGDRDFYSLFTGSGNVEANIKADRKYYNDTGICLQQMYNDLKTNKNYSIEEFCQLYNISTTYDYYTDIELLYQTLKDDYNNDVLEINKYTACVLYGCSYAGKFLGGFAHNKVKRNYLNNAINSTNKLINEGLVNNLVVCTDVDYKEFLNKDIHNSVFYLDPPYAKTTTYKDTQFDSDEFWQFVQQMSHNNLLFISEINNPLNLEIVMNKQYIRGLRNNNKQNVKSAELLLKVGR